VPQSEVFLCFKVKNIDRVFFRPENNYLTVTGHGATHSVLLEAVLEQNKSSLLLLKWKRESSPTAVCPSKTTPSLKEGTKKLALRRFAGNLYSMLCPIIIFLWKIGELK
jgi:hypothetical protein